MGDAAAGQDPDDRVGSRARWPLAALAVLALSLAGTWQAWRTAQADAAHHAQASFDFEVRGVEARLSERMLAYEQVLRGAVGLFVSSERVDRGEFRAYVEALRLAEQYPGIQGIGFARLVPAADLAAHEREIRREGFPGYTVWPAGQRDPYTAIVFLEPFSGRNLRAFGFDMYAEPVRHAAMQRARETGQAALSAKVTLVQETLQDVQAGTLLYLPVFRARPAAGAASGRGELLGWVYSPYRMDDLVRGMVGERALEIGLEVHDGAEPSPDDLLFDSTRGARLPPPAAARFRERRTIEVAGVRWTLVVRSLPTFEARVGTDRPRLVALMGAGASGLLALMVWVLAAGRAAALRGAARARRDLVERQRASDALLAAQRALAESEGRLRAAIAATSQVTWELDLETGARRFGPGWRELTGLEPDQAGSEAGWWALVHVDDQPAARARFSDAVEGRVERLQAELRISTARGWRWFRAMGGVTGRDARGRPLRMSGTLADVEAFHVLQEQLLAATRLASVGTLAAGLAHEINNPLSWMLANLDTAQELLATPAIDPAVARRHAELVGLLGEVLVGAERIAGIVRAMRSLGRPERAGQAQLVDVRGELLDAIKMIRNQVEQRAALVLDLPDDLPVVLAPTSELGRVFLNLVLNAAQAIPEGQAGAHRVGVSAWAAEGEVVVEVADTGPGIPPALLARIFEPFFTTRPVGQGTGLGLSIARSIVAAAGGRIEVVSEPGKGARFRVRLPVAGPAQALPAPSAPSHASPPARERPTVLLVDDEPMVARALARRLEPAHEVTMLGSAAEALRRLDAGERWDALVCDLMMPGMDGAAFHAALAERHPALLDHLAFITGGAFGDRAVRFLAEHRVVVLQKPVKERRLREVVARLARGEAGAVAAAAEEG